MRAKIKADLNNKLTKLNNYRPKLMKPRLQPVENFKILI